MLLEGKSFPAGCVTLYSKNKNTKIKIKRKKNAKNKNIQQ